MLDSSDHMSVCDLFSRALRARTLVLFSCWICAMVCLYALMLNVGDLSGDIFINYCLSITADIPAHFSIYFIVDRFGRISSLSATTRGKSFSLTN